MKQTEIDKRLKSLDLLKKSEEGSLVIYNKETLSRVNVSPFVNNCGIAIASSLGGNFGTQRMSLLMEWAKNYVRAQMKGLLLYSVNNEQEAVIAVLEETGFARTTKWIINPGHNSKIAIYSFDLNKLDKE